MAGALGRWWGESNWLTRGLAITVPVLLIALIAAFSVRSSTEDEGAALEADLGQTRSDLADIEARVAELEGRIEGTQVDSESQLDGYEALLDEASETLDEVQGAPPPTTEPPEPEEDGSGDDGEIPIIDGLEPVDVYLNLEQRGLECDRGERGQRFVVYRCESWGFSAVEVWGPSFSEVHYILADVIDPAEYGLLGFVATMPYEDAEPDRARSWVESNVAGVRQGEPVSRSFGGVRFQLSGAGPNAPGRFLSIGELS